MKFYRICAKVIYYFTVEAENEEEAIEKAGECEFEFDGAYNDTELEVTGILEEDEDFDWKSEPILNPPLHVGSVVTRYGRAPEDYFVVTKFDGGEYWAWSPPPHYMED